MCLAVTGRVLSVDGEQGQVLIGDTPRQVSFIALPGVEAGDHVLVSLGMALERLTAEEASEIDSAWDEIAQIDVETGGEAV